LAFEAALANVEARHGIVPKAAAERIFEISIRFEPDMEALRNAVSTDGVVLPALVRQLRAAIGVEFGPYVHVGAPSQDAIDPSLMLRLKAACTLVASRLGELAAAFGRVNDAFGSRPLMGRTRMQAAIPITVADRVASWMSPLEALRQRLGHAD